MFCLLPVEGWSNLESVVSLQAAAQEVTMLFKLIAAAKDSWACLISRHLWTLDLHIDKGVSMNSW